MKSWPLKLALILGAPFLHSATVQPETTPEFEEEILSLCAKTTKAPLSEALELLIRGISDQTFTKEFFSKIVQVESKKFTGEYLDHWENGQLKIKAHFKEGKVDGHVHGWFENGQEAFKAFFYENLKVGIHIAFYLDSPRRSLDGIARLFCYNFDGLLDSKQKSKEYSGDLKTLGRYRDGILHGSKIMYNLEGKCIRDEFYDNGKLVPGKKTESKN
ncbi:MAG: hypothetical protein P0S96_00935 [Simkaniaceae bacterium]|nr:hypothetical protein [Candidatus Sacchlamyda saccharinae]